MSKIIEEREFRNDLKDLLNRYSRENESNTPDFILAKFILDSVKAFDAAASLRDIWYEHHCSPELRAKIQYDGAAPKSTDTLSDMIKSQQS